MIVVDTCILIHLFNETQFTKFAQEVHKKDSLWIMPIIWQEEYANVISKLARKEKRPPREVINHFDYTLDKLKNCEKFVSNKLALELSLEYQISVYDAHFVVLAKEFQIPLITEDLEVIRRCPSIAINMKTYLIPK